MKVELIRMTEKPLELIAETASVCYGKSAKDPKALVQHLYSNGHHSVFEHVSFTFLVDGISRACSHQLVRHRLAAVTQRSQRYVDEGVFTYVTPYDIYQEEEAHKAYEEAMDKIHKLYKDFVELYGIPKEDARYLLPNACETKLYFTCNLRELMHIANERLCSRAQWEIRELVRQMCDLVPEDLRWMLVPKCKSGFITCNNPCKNRKET